MRNADVETIEDMQRQIKGLAAQLEIAHVLEKYLWLQDIAAWDEWELLLAEEVKLDVDDGRRRVRVQGRAEFRAYMEKALRGIPFVRHFLNVPSVVLEKDGRARARATFSVISTNRQGEQIMGTGFYEDLLVDRHGKWVIVEVTARMDFLGPREAGWGQRRAGSPRG